MNSETPSDSAPGAEVEGFEARGRIGRMMRRRVFARFRHRMGGMRRLVGMTTRAHAKLILLSGGRIRRSFVFTGGMPILVLTTTGRRSGRSRSTPLGFVPFGGGFAVTASNAGNDHTPNWLLNLQADPMAEVVVDRRRRLVRGRAATEAEDQAVWSTFAALNPGFDEYRKLTARRLPVVILEPVAGTPD